MTGPWAWLGLATGAATYGLHAYAAYSAGIALLSLAVRPRRHPPAERAKLPRFLVLIPAHDEQDVIGGLLDSLAATDYPSDHLQVQVIADRCGDATARIARDAGAEVMERKAGQPGKSGALADALRALPADADWDAVAVFDADNRVHRDFFRATSGRLARGEAFVQGRVDPKNPTGSWVAASSALGFYAITALVQRPRERLGLSTPVMGTGWVARLDPARDLLQSLTTLTDDLELSCLLTRRGVRVAYEDTAVVLDEKPLRLSDAVGQRQRWMQGRWSVLSTHGPSLLGQALGPRPASAGDRARALDQLVQVAGPSLLFTAVSLGVVAVLDAGARVVAPPSFVATRRPRPRFSLASAAAYYLLPALYIRHLDPPRAIWRFYGLQAGYLSLSGPLALSGFLRRASRRWRRTSRAASRGSGPAEVTSPSGAGSSAPLDPSTDR